MSDKNDEDRALLEGANSGAEKRLFASKRLRAPLGVGLVIVGGLAGAIWFNRAQISQDALIWALKSKGVDASINIKSLDLGEIEFEALKIGAKDHETLIAEHGKIDWHYDFKNGKLIVENFKANAIWAQFKLDEKGINFGSLEPLLAPSTGKSYVIIQNIEAKNSTLRLDTEYGNARADFDIKGSQALGFSGLGQVFLPAQFLGNNEIDSAPISLGFKTGAISNDDPLSAKFDFGINGQSIRGGSLFEGFNADNVRAQIMGSIQFDKNGADKLKTVTAEISNSFIKFGRLSYLSNSVQNANLAINKVFWQNGENFYQDALFSIDGQVDFDNGHFANQRIAKSESIFEIARAQNGTAFSAIRTNTNGLSGAFAARNFTGTLKLQTQLPRLDNLMTADLVGDLKINGKLAGFGLAPSARDMVSAVGFGDMLTQVSTALDLQIEKKAKNFTLEIKAPIVLDGAHQSRITFVPTQRNGANGANNLLVLALEKNKAAPLLNLNGNLSAQSDKGASLQSIVQNLSLHNGALSLNAINTSFRGVEYGGAKISGMLQRLDFGQDNSNKNANLAGKITINQSGKAQIENGVFDVNASLRNNQSAFVINGNVEKFATNEMQLKGAQIGFRGNVNLGAASGSQTKSGAFGKVAFYDTSLDIKARDFQSKEISGRGFHLAGTPNLVLDGANIAINGHDCLDFSVSNFQMSTSAFNDGSGKICPDAQNRIFAIIDNKPLIYAQSELNPITLQFGTNGEGQTLSFGRIKGRFDPTSSGGIGFAANSTNFSYRFKSGPESFATIDAQSAKIDFNGGANRSNFTLSLDGIITRNLPVSAQGKATANFTQSAQSGLAGNFVFTDILVQDALPQKRFGDMQVSGTGTLSNNLISIDAATKLDLGKSQIANLTFAHNLRTGVGNVAFDAKALNFSPYCDADGRNCLAAHDIVPLMRDIIVDAYGKVDGHANFAWAPNQPLKSEGVFTTERFDFGTKLGRVSHVSGSFSIADLLNPRTDGRQDLKIGLFEPGVPIVNGTIGVSFPGDKSVQLEEASWPFADGILRLQPVNWPFDQPNRDMVVDVDNIDIAKFLRLTSIKFLEIDGRMSGFLPIEVRDNVVSIVGGVLRAREGGGTFHYTGPETNTPKPKPSLWGQLQTRLNGKPLPQGADLAVAALRNLKYKVLEIRVNGRLTGDMNIMILLEGTNPDLLENVPFRFNVNMNLPLLQAIEGVKNVLDPNKQIDLFRLNGGQIEEEPETIEPPPIQPTPNP